jgi:S-adenosylmethionine:tRNA ribosyltransferase-isomerase
MRRLLQKGIEKVHTTLHVGAGTFLPVSAEDIRDHRMHREEAWIAPEAATLLNECRRAGGRIVAVGTTALRTLESAAMADGTIPSFHAETDIFITPGYSFRAVDVLLTNFHLPRSTLFMLVSAFMGLDVMQTAYAEAIRREYRFYSYGDACLLFRPR